jgi:hypothetical protein
MHPSWSQKLVFGKGEGNPLPKPTGNESLINLVKKI